MKINTIDKILSSLKEDYELKRLINWSTTSLLDECTDPIKKKVLKIELAIENAEIRVFESVIRTIEGNR